MKAKPKKDSHMTRVADMRINHHGTCQDGYQHATVEHLDAQGVTIETQRFDHPDAYEDAFWYVEAWRETQQYTLEERLGRQWEREQEARG